MYVLLQTLPGDIIMQGSQCCKIVKLFRRVARPLRYSGKFFRQLRIISQIFDCDKSEVE